MMLFRKLMLVILISLLSGFISVELSKAPQLEISVEYSKYYDSLFDRVLSQEEYEEFIRKEKEHLEEMSKPENVEKIVGSVISRKIVIILCLLVVWFYIGFKIRFKKIAHVVIASFSVLITLIYFVSFWEALTYSAMLAIGNKYSFWKTPSKKNTAEAQTPQ